MTKIIPLCCCCSKYMPLDPSHCHWGYEDLLFSLTLWNRVGNKLEPACTLWRQKRSLFSLLFGPWHKYYFRPSRSTRCFLPELQNVQWQGSFFLCLNWNVLEDQRWGMGARKKKNFLSVLRNWKEISVPATEATFIGGREGNELQFQHLEKSQTFKMPSAGNAWRWFGQLAWLWALTTETSSAATLVS